VEEARELSTMGSLRVEAPTIMVVAAAAITTEAQNALLKLFEEPQAGLTFVLLTPAFIIPTLRSRLLEYQKLQTTDPKSQTEAKKFLAAAAPARTAEITKMLKDEDGVKERVRELLFGLEQILAKNIVKKEAREALSDIAKIRSYINDRSPALKMLLEHLALSLPVLK
jgi:DNA polymerase III delta prime subunit